MKGYGLDKACISFIKMHIIIFNGMKNYLSMQIIVVSQYFPLHLMKLQLIYLNHWVPQPTK